MIKEKIRLILAIMSLQITTTKTVPITVKPLMTMALTMAKKWCEVTSIEDMNKMLRTVWNVIPSLMADEITVDEFSTLLKEVATEWSIRKEQQI